MKYRTLYADPPWEERGGGKITRGAQNHYPLKSTESICALVVDGLHVSMLFEKNAHCYLWVTNNFLLDGLSVLRAWGFEYKTMITWAKDRVGLGQYFRGQTEHVLFGVRGSVPYAVTEEGGRSQGTTLITAPRGRHSEKPAEMRKMIERVSPGPYLELFGRKLVDGWNVRGDDESLEAAL